MAIRRKDISGVLGEDSHISDDDMTKLLDLIHGEVDAVRDEKDSVAEQLKQAQADFETQLHKAQTDYDALKLTADSAEKAKSDAEKALTDFQAEQTAAAERTAHTAAYRSLLASAGIGEKHIDSIMRVTDMSGLKWNNDGSVRDSDRVVEGIKSEWADFIPATQTTGAEVETPPGNTPEIPTMTRDEIMAIKDRDERRAAIAANPQAFARKEG